MKIEQFNMTFPGEGDMALLLATAETGEGVALLGTVCVKVRTPCVAEFARLFVREGCRRKGVGRALLNHARQVAIRAGCSALSCSAHPDNSRALLFYRQLGFVVAFQFADGDMLLTLPIPPLLEVSTEGGAS